VLLRIPRPFLNREMKVVFKTVVRIGILQKHCRPLNLFPSELLYFILNKQNNQNLVKKSFIGL